MKTVAIAIAALILCGLKPFAQTTITPEEVSKHIGDSVTVCGKIYGGIFLSKSKNQPTFLNMGAAYPNELLTIVIWGGQRKYFKQPPEKALVNKEVCITGILETYKEKPQIIFYKPDQMQIK